MEATSTSGIDASGSTAGSDGVAAALELSTLGLLPLSLPIRTMTKAKAHKPYFQPKNTNFTIHTTSTITNDNQGRATTQDYNHNLTQHQFTKVIAKNMKIGIITLWGHELVNGQKPIKTNTSIAILAP